MSEDQQADQSRQWRLFVYHINTYSYIYRNTCGKEDNNQGVAFKWKQNLLQKREGLLLLKPPCRHAMLDLWAVRINPRTNSESLKV